MKQKILVSCCLFGLLNASEITLEKIDVEGSLISADVQSITQDEIQSTRTITLQDKLKRDVSFKTTTDPKGDDAISFRGLSFKATDFIEDGIPLYRTPSGYVDPSFHINNALINVHDGSSASALGVSPMGGVVELVSKKPAKDIQGNIHGTVSTNDEYFNASLGTKVNKSYVKIDVGYYNRDDFKLSNDFKTTSIQTSKTRLNSDREQKNFALKAGTHVNNNLHLATKISLARSEYGLSPNTNTDIVSPRWDAYTRIDQKDLNSYYLYADYTFSDILFNMRLYKDDYEDQWVIYKEPKYTTFDPITIYDDSRHGAILKANKKFDKHDGILLLQHEENEHIRDGGAMPTEKYTLDTYKLSYLHKYNISQALMLDGGISYTLQNTSNPLISDKDMIDAQAKLSYTQGASTSYIAVGKKSRMATTEEMSTFFPWSVANPNIKPEQSLQYSLGYERDVDNKTSFSIATYYYKIKDLIVNASNQYINQDKAKHYGAEFRVDTKQIKDNFIRLSYAYSYAKDSSKQRLENIPYNKFKLEDRVSLTKSLEGYLSYQFIGARYTYNSATYTSEFMKLSEYHLADAQVKYAYSNVVDARVGIKNLLDEVYETYYGYPTPGRNYYISLNWKL